MREAIASFDYPERYRRYLYEGLGMAVANRTFGHLFDHDLFSKEGIPEEYISDFYRGYSMALELRYGEDRDEINSVIAANVKPRFHKDITRDHE